VLLIRVLHEQNKIELTPQIDVDAILVAMTEKYKNRDSYYHWSEN
jgi:hypothetical protein